jgi:holo-[acyl-carrier protein] synthase
MSCGLPAGSSIRIGWLSPRPGREQLGLELAVQLRTGVDLIEIARIEEVITRHGRHYLDRVYTPAELDQAARQTESLAGRFAAKEAVAKALGTGIGEIGWKEIEILGDDQSAPTLKLHGAAASKAEELGLSAWSVSISHSMSHAVAIAVAIGTDGAI